MDNPRLERYLTSPTRKQNPWEARLRKTCSDLARKIGLRQLKPRTALIAGMLFAVLAGFGLVRSGLFKASDAAITPRPSAAPAAIQPVETTVTVHVVVDQSQTAVTAGESVPTADPTQTTGGKIDLNSADAGALDTLPGVGPATARKIIADRQANGPFTSPEDLMRVSGIGQKKFDALKDLITVGK